MSHAEILREVFTIACANILASLSGYDPVLIKNNILTKTPDKILEPFTYNGKFSSVMTYYPGIFRIPITEAEYNNAVKTIEANFDEKYMKDFMKKYIIEYRETMINGS